MPDTTQDKTELPSPRRRQEARKQGQVALSADLTSGVLLLSGVLVFSVASPAMGARLQSLLRYQLTHPIHDLWSPELTCQLAVALARYALGIIGFVLLGVVLAGLAVNVLQVGFHVSGEALSLKWSRLSPASGMKRIFSLRGVMRTLLGITKLVAVSVAVTWALYGRGSADFLDDSGSLSDAVVSGWKTVVFAALVAAVVLTVIGILDFAFQRWQHEQDLRMSRREVQEEHKQEEGDPLIKARVRKLQRELAKHKMIRDVPEASVVLTNPTHLAVAIKYDRGVMPAPKIVAKGDGALAKRIVRVARDNGVPILERKPLARALFAMAEVGQEIPAALYQALAEVLAYVYQLPNSR